MRSVLGHRRHSAAGMRFLFLSLLIASGSAAASPCSDLDQRQTSNKAAMLQLVADYPGTNLVIGLCAAAAANEYETTKSGERATGLFAVCAGGGCALAGFDNCGEVTKRWFALALTEQQITARKRELGC